MPRFCAGGLDKGSPLLLSLSWQTKMFDETAITQSVDRMLVETDAFVVEVHINASHIVVAMDSKHGIDLDLCTRVTRQLQTEWGEELDTYDLEVGSVGITAPLRTLKQFQCVTGECVTVQPHKGKKIVGVLQCADKNGFVIAYEQKIAVEGQKHKTLQTVEQRFDYKDVVSVCRTL